MRQISIVAFLFSLSTVFCFANTTVHVDFVPHPCPQVLGCQCVDQQLSHVECHRINAKKIDELQAHYGDTVEILKLAEWEDDIINFDVFSNFTMLRELFVVDGELETVNATEVMPKLTKLVLDHNEIEDETEICRVIKLMPALRYLSISRNYLTKFDCVMAPSTPAIVAMNLDGNQIEYIGALPKSLARLNVSTNSLTSIKNVSDSIVVLDASYNLLTSWAPRTFPRLTMLNVSGLLATDGFEVDAPKLETLRMDETQLRFLDLKKVKTPMLKSLIAHKSKQLRALSGKLPRGVETVSITHTQLYTVPVDFFAEVAASNDPFGKVKLSSTKMTCEACLLRWALPVFDKIVFGKDCNLTRDAVEEANCTLGISKSIPIQYGFYEDDPMVQCLAYGNDTPRIRWYRHRPSTYLGSYDPKTGKIDYTNVTSLAKESYQIMPGGTLLIHSANRSHVERYVCVAENQHGKTFETLRFRLDYTDWYSLHVFRSVFFGGLATALIVCLASFLLNITWILTRKSALWWIQRAERLSRVRKMVEAMEKYRARQLESLHDKYTKRVQIVRDNYHQQVEALRVSYSSQSEKFRDYRTAQMDAVSSHLESLRENYNSQLSRVRDYGSRRADQLWESYERQVNRMRTFSLQQRLKMMRQYKVKQRYLNKLLESFQACSPEEMLKHEEEVRAALELPEAYDVADRDEPGTSSRLSRSSSFHSLPEYVIDEHGNVRPSPISPASTASVRFAHRVPPTPSSFSRISTNSEDVALLDRRGNNGRPSNDAANGGGEASTSGGGASEPSTSRA